MTDWIDTLDDATAGRVLAGYAGAQGESQVRDCPPELRAAMAAEFGPSTEPRAGEGDLARAALRVICQDPAQAQVLRAMANGPRAERLGVLTAIGLVAAVLVVLQTHVKFDRDKQGQWCLKIEKKPTSDKLLRDLVHKLLPFLDSGSDGE